MQRSILNETITKSGSKIDCAKECPCGVPVIPVPDQWLEVMVTGGFKVWHIIFIIIAFVVIMIVVYCCFHRCRIPRTKQEIEADLMRMNLTNKFRDYLQELPNEQTTFVEALKKVQELEEKLEKEDAEFSRDLGARKRMGWLKLKGKGDKEASEQPTKGVDVAPQESGGELEKKALETSELAAPKSNDVSTAPVMAPSAEPIIPVTVPISAPANLLAPPMVSTGKSATNELRVVSSTKAKVDKTEGERNEIKDVAKKETVARRRKNKPNLARTKAPRKSSHVLELEPTMGPMQVQSPPVPVEGQPTNEQTIRQPINPHHRHRVKKEARITIASETAQKETRTLMALKISSTLAIVYLALTIWAVEIVTCLQASANSNDGLDDFPLIWPAIRTDKTYHLVFELQMMASSERLTIEEWAAFDESKFRLDLISAEGRTSYLTNGNTNEIFRYRPFTCDRLEPNSNELDILASLFMGYTLQKQQQQQTDQPPVPAFGLGPLWLRAKTDAKKITKKDPSKLDSADNRDKQTMYYITFEQKPDQVIYGLNFYFKREKFQFVDSVEWVGISGKKESIEARAKLIQIDLSPMKKSWIFDLPTGYGCQRAPEIDHPMQADLGLDILHEGAPNMATISVSISRPLDTMMSAWDSSRYLAQLLKGTLLLNGLTHNYHVTLVQERPLDSMEVKRTRKIWSALEDCEQALVYTIDENTGACKVEHVQYADHVRLNFPGQKDGQANAEAPFTLSLDLITSLFNNGLNYHLIKEGTTGLGFQETIFEQRLEHVTLANGATVVWAGPASIVRRIQSPLYLEVENQEPDLMNSIHQTITIFFYSDDLTKLLYKTVIDLVGANDVDIGFLQKELDVGSCFSEDQKQEVVIKYPIESRKFGKGLEAVQDIILGLFSLNLFGTTAIQPIQVSKLETTFDNFYMHIRMTLIDLPLTQIYEFHSNKRLVGKKENSEASSSTLEQIAPNVEKCAISCDYYNCFRFSFDSISHNCQLELVRDGAEVEDHANSQLYSSNSLKANSSIWLNQQQAGGRIHLKPSTIIELLAEIVESYEKGEYHNYKEGKGEDDYEEEREKEDESSDSGEERPLVIRVAKEVLPDSSAYQGQDWFKLWPVSVVSESKLAREFTHKLQMDEQSIDGSDLLHLKVQYGHVATDRQFKSSTKGLRFDNVATYEDCAQICEENDCQSFSYCQFELQCFVTDLHAQKDISKTIVRDPKCDVFALDYMSKFDDFGSVEAPTRAEKTIENLSPRDCAIACMEEKHFDCQGFHVCGLKRENTISKTCLMHKEHIYETNLGANLWTPSETSKSNQDYKKCKFYSRSYLAQFNKHYERTINLVGEKDANNGENLVMDTIEGVNAENCAKACIERACLVFDVCLDENSIPVCRMRQRIGTNKSQLDYHKHCTTFSLSDKSQFNSIKTSLVKDKPDREAAVSELSDISDGTQQASLGADLNADFLNLFAARKREKRVSGSHWSYKLMSIASGAFLGVGCVALWRSRDDMYLFASRFAGRRG